MRQWNKRDPIRDVRQIRPTASDDIRILPMRQHGFAPRRFRESTIVSRLHASDLNEPHLFSPVVRDRNKTPRISRIPQIL